MTRIEKFGKPALMHTLYRANQHRSLLQNAGPRHCHEYHHLTTDTNQERQQGRKAQLSNIQAAKTIADIIRTCLGPRAMLKMLLDPMGGIVLTNDGNAILRECEVAHPAAKSKIGRASCRERV